MPQPMTMAEAFDEWMRKYKEDPDGFLNGMQAAKAHERNTGGDQRASDYGNDCADLLARLMAVGKAAWDPIPVGTKAADAAVEG